MNAVPALPREEEMDLIRTYLRTGDRKAAERVVSASLRHIIPIALRYRYYGIPLPELLAQGCVALATAIDRFDPERGVRFATYANHWVRAELLAYALKNRTLVGGGRGPRRARYVFRMRREHRALLAQLGPSELVNERLGQSFGKSAQEIAEILSCIDARDASLDARGDAEDGVGSALIDGLASDTEQADEALEHSRRHAQMKGAIAGAMRVLNDRERFIVEQRVVADAEERLSLVDIGKHFGVSRERARQLESNALLKLRKQLVAA
jgi:RNA polymerase sigma-32 factor